MLEEVFEYNGRSAPRVGQWWRCHILVPRLNHHKQLQTFFKHVRGNRLGRGDILKFTTSAVLKAVANKLG